MLSEAQFTELMKIIEDTDTAISKEMSLFSELLEDADGVPRNLARLQDSLTSFVSEQMGDTEEVIDWFIYDSCFGTVPVEWSEGVEFTTVASLYAYLQSKGG